MLRRNSENACTLPSDQSIRSKACATLDAAPTHIANVISIPVLTTAIGALLLSLSSTIVAIPVIVNMIVNLISNILVTIIIFVMVGDRVSPIVRWILKILDDPKSPKPGELWCYRIPRSCRIFSINSSTDCSEDLIADEFKFPKARKGLAEAVPLMP